MDDRFWKAAGAVIGSLRESGCAESTVEYHERAIGSLAAHLDETGDDCTTKSVGDWLDGMSAGRSDGTCSQYRIAARRLLAHLGDGGANCDAAVRPRLSSVADTLVGWAGDAVSSFRDAFGRTCTPEVADLAASHAAQFLVAVGGRGVTPADLTAHAVHDYVLGCPGAPTTRAQRASHVRSFLGHLAGLGEVPAWLPLVAREDLPANGACLVGVPEWPDETGDDPSVVVSASARVCERLSGLGYSDTPVYEAKVAGEALWVALSVAGVPFTPGNALAWLGASSEAMGSVAGAYARAVGRIVDEIAPERAVNAGPDLGGVPSWARAELASYLDVRRREGAAQSTLECTLRACARFLAHADASGARGWRDLGADVVASWCASDPHETAGGRACYVSKVRGLLSHLELAGVVATGLSLAAPAGCAPSERVVSTLGDAQVAAIAAARLEASTPMELRDAAMVALGLTMGMRAGDVVGLCLGDLDLSEGSVTFVQAKTSRRTTLPLTTAAGNAIVAWLRDGRPRDAPSPRLFVSLKAPHGPLHRSACGKALHRTLGDAPFTFHDLRRTLATRMLRAGAGRSDVTDALGHASEASARPYLSLDEERMRMCALSPEDVGIGDGGGAS